MKTVFNSHIYKKTIMRQELENDNNVENSICAVICFDLENVIKIP